MNTRPIWKEVKPLIYPPLERDLNVEVLVIGGGITGVSTAHLLTLAGLKVALVERDRLGSGDTAHTTAHLTYMTDAPWSELVRVCGAEIATLAWMAGRKAMERIHQIAATLPVDVGLRRVPGYLVAAGCDDPETEARRLHEEADRIAHMGFDARYIEGISPTNQPGILFSDQMKFHPLKYLAAVAAETARLGAAIYEQTDVAEFRDGRRHVVANGRRISYRNVVIATHVPLQGARGTMGSALFQTKLSSYSTYAVAAKVPPGLLPEMIWSDTAEPFNYLRVDRGQVHDVAIFGGEDHKTGQVEETCGCFGRLEERLARMIPVAEVTHRWSGQVVETVDGLPYIGENAPGQFIATGFSGNGMTFGMVAAMLIRDIITGRPNPWEDTFHPSRVELAAGGNYLRENSDFPYRLVKDRLAVEEGEPHRLRPGEGRVMKLGCETVAVCRDADGTLHHHCAVCPHLGCIVAWNDCEMTWDCPCHGSRFAANGSLIAGPAEKPLSLADPAGGRRR